MTCLTEVSELRKNERHAKEGLRLTVRVGEVDARTRKVNSCLAVLSDRALRRWAHGMKNFLNYDYLVRF